jgi:xylulokinase
MDEFLDSVPSSERLTAVSQVLDMQRRRQEARSGSEKGFPVRYLLGVDVGTSSVKVAAFNRRGRRVALASAPCRVSRLRPGWVEHDPRQTWRSTARALRSLFSEGGIVAARVAAVGLSGHFSTIFLDDADAPAAPCLTWLDSRSVEEAEWLATRVGAAKMARWHGIRLPISAAMPPARVLWVSRHCPADLARVTWTGQTKDYIGWRLHGRRVSDAHSLMGLVRVPDGRVSAEYLRVLGLSPGAIPQVERPWEVAGQVTAAAARATGLRAGTPVVTGWIDAYCSMLGTGMGEPALAFDVAGTSEVVGLATADPVETRNHRGQLVIPLDERAMVVYGLTNAGADSLSWARKLVGRGVSYSKLMQEAEAVPVTPAGPLFLPYLEGERSPVWDEGATGALVGLRREHERGHLVRAVIEGVAFSVRHNLDCARAVAGATLEGIRVAGGGARGDVWNQTKADVLNLPVHLVAEPEAGALGAAMLAALGMGWYGSLGSAAAGMVRVARTWLPRRAVRATYDTLYRRYLALYPALKGASGG